MLKRYKDSLSDLVHLQKVDPKNTAAQREMELVKDYWRQVQIMYMYTEGKKSESLRDGYILLIVQNHADSCKMYCTHISLEFWSTVLRNSSAISYISFLFILVNVLTISMDLLDICALHLPLKVSLFKRFIKFYAIYIHKHF